MKKMIVRMIWVGVCCISSVVGANEFKKMEKDLKKMQQELNLTQDQVAQIRAIWEEKRAERIDVQPMEQEGVSQGLIRAKLERINDEEKREITAVLSEKQLKIRSVLNKKAAEKVKQEVGSKK